MALYEYCILTFSIALVCVCVSSRFAILTCLRVCLLPLVVDKRGTGSSSRGYTLSSASSGTAANATATTATRNSSTGGPAASTSTSNSSRERREEMLAVRLRQQEIANERHVQAEKLRNLKKEEERTRKNMVAQAAAKNTSANEDRLGGGDSGSGGYNPMMPSSGVSRGYR
jgi:hypothetical protein